MATNAAIREYYDEFQMRLIRDYVNGNKRLEKAVEFIGSQINQSITKVLDIGCGIGSSSFQLSQLHPHIEVLGVDISTKNVETARTLHETERVKFLSSDLTEVPDGGPFDLISIIDVYEHIPVDARERFHQSVSAALSEDGIVITTTPSPLHQRWLAEHDPEGLQIVDETIRIGDLVAFGSDLGATLVRYEWVNVWHSNQYCYSVFARNPKYESPNSVAQVPQETLSRVATRFIRQLRSSVVAPAKSTGVLERKKRVKALLGVDVK